MKRRPVLVPVVQAQTERDAPARTAICTLWCEPAPRGEHPTDIPSDADLRLAPVAAPLLEANLFDSGCTAAMAVRKLGLAPPPLAIRQRLRPQAWLQGRRLYAADAVPTIGSSAELGLALALLLPCSRFRGLVMATGSLSEPEGCGTGSTRPAEPPVTAVHPSMDTDTSVYPVGALADKLARLREHACAVRDGGGPAVICFTPRTDAAGVPTEDLPETQALRDLGVAVVPVGSLGEAVDRLGCRRWPWLVTDWLALGLVGALAVGAALWVWRDWPIPLAFERGGGEAGYTEPFIACVAPDERYTLAKPLPRRGVIAGIGAGDKLTWTVGVGDPRAWDAQVLRRFGSAGYHLLFAVVFADGKVELQDHTPAGGQRAASPSYRVAPGDPWAQWYEVPQASAEGEAALVILARRDRPFDIDRLHRGLDAVAGAPAPERRNRALGYLETQAPGFLYFQFDRWSHVPSPCPSE